MSFYVYFYAMTLQGFIKYYIPPQSCMHARMLAVKNILNYTQSR
jgi:hypothetical protein